MSFSFSSLVRLIVIVALGTTMLAIGLSKLDPPRPSWRTRLEPKYFYINEYLMNFADRTPRWFNAETGKVEPFAVQDGDVLEAASCSPWVDTNGEHQAVGRWASRTRMGPLSISTDFGLARYSFPSGQLLDHVSTEIVPVGPPCWFPGIQARVLFAAGDGELYQYAFEADAYAKELDPVAKRDPKPTPLTWRCPKPGLGNVFLSDLTWPDDPRMSGCVVVALREQSAKSEINRSFTGTSLWWLKLNFAGTEILEAGPLLVTGGKHRLDSPIDQRCPTVGKLRNNQLALAYLSEAVDKPGWQLRIAPMEFGGDHQVPIVHEEKSVLLSTECHPAYPAFSADGRWLNAIVLSSETNGKVIRVPLADVFKPKE